MSKAELQGLHKQELTNEIIFAEAEAMRTIFNAKKKALSLTQRELAVRFNVKPPSIFAYLNGQTALNIKFASFFADQLKVSIDEFSPRLSTEYGKLLGKIDHESYRYPLLNINDIDEYKKITEIINEGKQYRKSFPTDINAGPNGFWMELDSDDMNSHNAGFGFCKGVLLLVNPDEKPRVNEFALLKIKYENTESSIIESNYKYIFRAIAHNGSNVEARALNPNTCSITVTDTNTTLVGKVVSALYPPEMLII